MSTETVKRIDITPTWTAAMRIYIAVLENPKADESAKQAARDDLLELAAKVDERNASVEDES